MRAILTSIRPEHLVNILNGDKPFELRSVCPNIELPCIALLYCCKSSKYLLDWDYQNGKKTWFLWDKRKHKYPLKHEQLDNGKVLAKCVMTECIDWHNYSWQEVCRLGCVSDQQLRDYAKNKKNIYLWHLENIEIFDKPKDISNFYTTHLDKTIPELFDNSIQLPNGVWVKPLTRAPQSWCYVEV